MPDLVAPSPTAMQNLPGAVAPFDNGAIAEVQVVDVRRDKEYAVSGRFSSIVSRNTAEVLATHADEILRFLGPKAYDRMELDAEVSKCIRILKTYTLSDGLDVSPAVPQQDPLFESAKWIADFVSRSKDNLSISLRDILEQQLDAIKYGHKVAEITYEFKETGTDAGLYHLKHIKTLKQGAVAFVRDKFKNVLGFKVATDRGKKNKRVIHRDKFFVLTFRAQDADPRGTSFLKAVYHAWHFKMMVWPEYTTWLKQCAVPGLVGITSAENDAKNYVRNSDGSYATDPNGNFIAIPATSQLADALAAMRNATAIAIPAGSQVVPVNNSVSSEPFRTGIDVANEEIEMAMLLQTLATSDSRHNTRAASQVAITVLDVLVFDIKNVVVEAFKRDVVRQLLLVNIEKLSEKLGITQEQVLSLVPKLTLGDSERRAWAGDIGAVTQAYDSKVIKESQLPGIYRQLGLEQAEEEEHKLAVEKAKQEVEALKAKQQSNISTGNTGGTTDG
jgi:hypothetical protein